LETTSNCLLAAKFSNVLVIPKKNYCSPNMVNGAITRIGQAIGGNFKVVGAVKDMSQFL
jgi:hypothetical protein